MSVVHELTTTREPVAELHTYHRNPRQGDLAAIRESLRVNGQYRPLVCNRGTHTGRPREVLAGNHTLKAARDEGWADVAVCWVDVDDDQAARIVAADNRTADLGDYDERLLAELLGELPDLGGTGYDEGDLDRLVRDLSGEAVSGDPGAEERPSLADRFLIPPFSVLDARSGWWQKRKRAWLTVGMQSELGRDETLTWQGAAGEDVDYYRHREGTKGGIRSEEGRGRVLRGGKNRSPQPDSDYFKRLESEPGRGGHLAYKAVSSDTHYYDQKRVVEARLGRTLTHAEFEAEHYEPASRRQQGTSIFDPVLCEIVYRWFSPPGGAVLDPWAGGSVRGIVAALLGRKYTGVELRPEQVAANVSQAEAILGADHRGPPRWIEGDCLDVLPRLKPADLVFGCPPYYDLETYSDDPRDLSNMDTAGFNIAYRRMIAEAAERLRPDRYAVFVVGSARDRHGVLRDLSGLTVDSAARAGLRLLNEAVLVTMAGSLPFRAGRSFAGTRVLGRTHQNVLVFVNGDRKRACQACGDVDAGDLAAALEWVARADPGGGPVDGPDAAVDGPDTTAPPTG